MDGWFRDALFLPAAVPVYLWIERRAGFRKNDAPPAWTELFLLFVLWSLAAEILAPLIFPHCTADPLDVVAYAGGGILAGLCWTRRKQTDTRQSSPRPQH